MGDGLRAIIDEYLFERSTKSRSTTEFTCQISSHLKMYSSLVRRVNIVLEVSGVKQRVEVITSNDDLTAELIVVASHAGAKIHSLSPDIVPPDFRITSTQALRAAIHLGSIDSILTNTDLKSHTVFAVTTGAGKSALFTLPILIHKGMSHNSSLYTEYPPLNARKNPVRIVVTPTIGVAANIVNRLVAEIPVLDGPDGVENRERSGIGGGIGVLL
ncbi:hypothetical protein C8J56DRAFT_1165116 [Mycena floridula]|nr:hypothetical protein C8J56DRAFT_1165116 [Mycena floridula]